MQNSIDSLFLDNCIAVAGADFKKLDKENKVIIFDNERRSVEILKRIREIIDLDYKVVLLLDDIREKDINDMILSGKSKHEIMNIISKNTFSGNKNEVRNMEKEKCLIIFYQHRIKSLFTYQGTQDGCLKKTEKLGVKL